MWVSKVSELIGTSEDSFEAAARGVVERSNRTLRGVRWIEIVEKDVSVEDGRIAEYRVRVRLSFDMAPETLWHW
jgi:flavin-binding protein dodecin